jgi:hypothetical protein
MAGSRERLLHENRLTYDYEYDHRRRQENRYERKPERDRYRYERDETFERPRRKNGYVYEDIYSDFDEAQGRLSLFRPIRPEYLNLPTSYDVKYNSLPRGYYNYEDKNDRNNRKYNKDYYDFRIEQDRRRTREMYEPYKRRTPEVRRKEIDIRDRNTDDRRYKMKEMKIDERRPNTEDKPKIVTHDRNPKPKNVAVCKPLRLSEKNARYWTTEFSERSRPRPKRNEEPKKNVKFSEVSGCNRKMIVDDPICGRKVVPVRELEVSLDQMIQNGYFEKHNIPISRPLERVPVKQEMPASAVPNGNCLSGTGVVGKGLPPPRKMRHLPQVSVIFNEVIYCSL